jgi:hypothetical protein
MVTYKDLTTWNDSDLAATVGTNVQSFLVDKHMRLQSVYAKNETNLCFMEIYLRQTNVTTDRRRHYFSDACKMSTDSREANSALVNHILQPGDRIVWTFKGCVVGDDLYWGFAWREP